MGYITYYYQLTRNGAKIGDIGAIPSSSKDDAVEGILLDLRRLGHDTDDFDYVSRGIRSFEIKNGPVDTAEYVIKVNMDKHALENANYATT